MMFDGPMGAVCAKLFLSDAEPQLIRWATTYRGLPSSFGIKMATSEAHMTQREAP
jgi:hypothetical protein